MSNALFYENGMTVNDLKVLIEKAIEHGCGDALIQVQADADGISDIGINGFECFGDDYFGQKIFSIVSAKDEHQFKNIYGKQQAED